MGFYRRRVNLPFGMGSAPAAPITFNQNGETFPLRKVLLCAASEIAVFGWVPTTGPNYEPDATKNRVFRHLAGTDDDKRMLNQTLLTDAKTKGIDLFAPEFGKAVDAAIEWAKGLSMSSNYLARLKLLADSGVVQQRDFGWACTLLNTYTKEKKAAATSKSQYVGTIKDKVEGIVSITSAVLFPNFGKALIKGLMAGTDNIVTWWTEPVYSDSAPYDVPPSLTPPFTVGDLLTVKGRVKTHKTYKGVCETQLHYVKAVKV